MLFLNVSVTLYILMFQNIVSNRVIILLSLGTNVVVCGTLTECLFVLFIISFINNCPFITKKIILIRLIVIIVQDMCAIFGGPWFKLLKEILLYLSENKFQLSILKFYILQYAFYSVICPSIHIRFCHGCLKKYFRTLCIRNGFIINYFATWLLSHLLFRHLFISINL